MAITRTAYRERQRLTADDLRTEQEYRLGLAGRHHLTHHDWGVVRGLRLLTNVHGGFTLTPGVAIDGYGREILVPEAFDLEGGDDRQPDLKRCWRLFLYYCEAPEQLPPRRACQDEPAPRVAQRFAWVLSESSTPLPGVAADLGRARAAGRPQGVQPWPLLVARFGLGCHDLEDEDAPLVDYGGVRYVRHHASFIGSPTRRAALQLGLSSRTDVYHVLLSTRDDGSGLMRRIGIDRDTVTHVWRPLVISGAKAVGQAAVSESRLLKIAAPMPAGIGRRIRITGVLDPSNQTLSASLLDLGAANATVRPALEASLAFAVNRPLSATVLFGEARSAAFDLIDATHFAPVPLADVRRLARRRRHEADEAPVVSAQRFSAVLKPAGGELVVRHGLRRADETAAPACGDIARSRAAAGAPGTPVVQFRPAAAIDADPLAREIHAVTTSLGSDPVPKTELRVSGGAEDESDASARLAIGAWADNNGTTEWMPSLRMDGGRRVAILARPGSPTTDPLLEVDDTVYLPPIGRKDPLLPDLMAMAFMAGLRQIGRIAPAGVVTLALNDLPDPIVRGATLTYKLTVGWTAGLEVKRCLEIITGTAGSGEMAFRTLTGLSSAQATYTITTDKFTHHARKVRIEIQMLVSKNDVTRVALCTSGDIDVQDPA
jgi:hypothetical protein